MSVPVIAIGGSAGSIGVLRQLVAELPADLPAATLIVVHLSRDAPSRLPEILSQMGGLPASHPRNGQSLQPGHIYVAPPDRHLALKPDQTLTLSRGPSENRHRPAIDPLFRSVAACCDGSTVGVLLSGLLDDGARGLAIIHASGGRTIVQDPDDAAFSAMPANAIALDQPDFILPARDLAAQLRRMIATPSPSHPVNQVPAPACVPTGFSCPECHGVLMQDGETLRCRIGHAYGVASLAAAYNHGTELALGVAMRAHPSPAAWISPG